MATTIVVDSGLALATVLQEPVTEKARILFDQWSAQGAQLAAPALFRYEVVAVMRKAVFRGLLSHDEAAAGQNLMLALPMRFYLTNTLLKRAYAIAVRFNRPTAYDAQYLAVAESLGCAFWTADERLYNAVSKQLDWVYWVGHAQI